MEETVEGMRTEGIIRMERESKQPKGRRNRRY
jgi:hypothetical protein